MNASLLLGVVLLVAAVACAAVAVVLPGRPRVPRSRLDPAAAANAGSRLSGAAAGTTALAERLLVRTGRTEPVERALERAGMSVRPADVVVVTAGAALGAAALGVLLGGPLLGLVLLAAAPLGAGAFVGNRRRRRQRLFTEQLDDSLQLLAGSLRAGHSVLRALDAVSRDTQAPTSEEFTRVINETRVGRDVNLALAEVAERTASDDFAWVVQAIGIHREVGGNLAEVLDGVAGTIRERNELRREASALSAEGRMSGIVLLVMPFAVVGVLAVVSPSYLDPMFTTGGGLVMVAIAGGLMAVGAVWLRKIVQVRF